MIAGPDTDDAVSPEASPDDRYLRWGLSACWCVAGLVGTTVGLSPTLSQFVHSAVGRDSSTTEDTVIAPFFIALILTAQLAAFLGFYWMLSRREIPRHALVTASFFYMAVVFAAWWPVRTNNLLVRVDADTVLSYQAEAREPIQLTGRDARVAWSNRQHDEFREL